VAEFLSKKIDPVTLGLTMSNDEKGMHRLRECLISEFEIKDLGRLKYFLGIEVTFNIRHFHFPTKIYHRPSN